MARKRPPRFHGLVAVDKPAGPTSHDVVSWLRWVLRQRAVGHCGTLDPAATGVLLVCVGPATRLTGRLTLEDKSYAARFALGSSTTTADAQGELLERVKVSLEQGDAACRALESMVGSLRLRPPAFSAIRIAGVRSHTLARAGEPIEIERREMIIRDLRELSLVPSEVEGEVWIDAHLSVSKGTYIRSIAEEIGRRVGLPCHLRTLRRTASGRVSLSLPQIVSPGATVDEERGDRRWRLGEQLLSEPGGAEDSRDHMGEIVASKLLDPLDFLIEPVARVSLEGAGPEGIKRLCHGQKLAQASPSGQALLRAARHAFGDRALPSSFALRFEPAPGQGATLVDVETRPAQGERGACLAPLRVLRLPRVGPCEGASLGS